MSFEAVFQFRQLGQDMAVAGDGAAHAYKSENDEHAHLDGAFGVQDGSGHDGAVFGEGVGQITGAAVSFT